MTSLFHLLAADTSCTKQSLDGAQFCTDLPTGGASGSNLQHLLELVIGVMGALAVLLIVIAGLNLVTAGGDPQKVAKARSTIVYALIGLVIAIAAEGIVVFVIGKLA